MFFILLILYRAIEVRLCLSSQVSAPLPPPPLSQVSSSLNHLPTPVIPSIVITPDYNTQTSVSNSLRENDSSLLLPPSSPPLSPPGPWLSPNDASPTLPVADWLEHELYEDVFNLDAPLPHLYPTSSAVSPSSVIDCNGVPVEWTPGSVWDTYPFHQHGIRDHPWAPIAFEGNENWLRLRSNQCSIVFSGSETNAPCCAQCAAIPGSPAFKKFITRATHVQDHTPYAYLSHRQLLKLLRSTIERYRKLSSQVCFRSDYRVCSLINVTLISATKSRKKTHERPKKD